MDLVKKQYLRSSGSYGGSIFICPDRGRGRCRRFEETWRCAGSTLFCGFFGRKDLPDILFSRGHRRQFMEVGVYGVGIDACKCGLSRAWRAPKYERKNMA